MSPTLQTVSGLQRTAALDENEQLTPLGRHLAALPVDIGVGRLVIYGSLLRCAQPILLIAAALSDRSPFLSPMHKRDEAKAVQAAFNTFQSDHLAVVEAYRKWEDVVRTQGKSAGHRFCEKHFLSERTLSGMSDMAAQFWDQLAAQGLLPRLKGIRDHDEKAQARADANRNSDNVELLKAVRPSAAKPTAPPRVARAGLLPPSSPGTRRQPTCCLAGAPPSRVAGALRRPLPQRAQGNERDGPQQQGRPPAAPAQAKGRDPPVVLQPRPAAHRLGLAGLPREGAHLTVPDLISPYLI